MRNEVDEVSVIASALCVLRRWSFVALYTGKWMGLRHAAGGVVFFFFFFFFRGGESTFVMLGMGWSRSLMLITVVVYAGDAIV